MITFILHCSSFSTTSAPIPLLPPVITATRPGCSNNSNKIIRSHLCSTFYLIQNKHAITSTTYQLYYIFASNSLRLDHVYQDTATIPQIETVASSLAFVSMIFPHKMPQILKHSTVQITASL